LSRRPPKQERREMNWLVLLVCLVIAAAVAWVVYEIVELLAAL